MIRELIDALTRDEFIALDPALSLLHANELIVNTLATGQSGGWRYRIDPDGRFDPDYFHTAEQAAYARYLAMQDAGP